MTPSDRDYVQRLGQVLRQRDPTALAAFLTEQAARFGDERQVADIAAKSPAELESLLHRMILARPDLDDLHPESRRWLAARGEGVQPGQGRTGRKRRPRGSGPPPQHAPRRPKS